MDALRAAFPSSDALDEFAVPLGLLGPHPPEVWGAIGRTVAVAALLEDRLVSLLQMLTLSEQSEYAKSTPTDVIERLRGQAPAEDSAWAGWAEWLDGAVDAFEWRNHVVHNLWPAQPGDRFFGHRLSREGERISMDTTREDLLNRLVHLAGITAEAQRWIALAGVEAGRRWSARARTARDADSDGASVDDGQA